MDIGEVTNSVMDTPIRGQAVTVESTGSDKCYGCDRKSYSLFNLGIQLAQVESYTTALETELRENENLEEKPSSASAEQAQSTDSDELQVNSPTVKEPSPTVICGAVSFRTNPVTDDEDDELKVGDKVIYVGKKYQESIGNLVMKVVKISVHWTGNQLTCSYDRGWTTWIPENCLKRVDR